MKLNAAYRLAAKYTIKDYALNLDADALAKSLSKVLKFKLGATVNHRMSVSGRRASLDIQYEVPARAIAPLAFKDAQLHVNLELQSEGSSWDSHAELLASLVFTDKLGDRKEHRIAVLEAEVNLANAALTRISQSL